MNQYEFIETELSEGVLTLKLNRPERLNSTNRKLHNELSRVFTDASLDPACEIIVLTGNGRAFSAGGDLEFLLLCINDSTVFDEVAYEGKKIVYSMLDCEKPIIGKINGAFVKALLVEFGRGLTAEVEVNGKRRTVEEKIWELQQSKAQTIADVLGEEGFARSLSKTDLEYLFAED